MLSGLFWNCRGIGEKKKRDFIKEQIGKNNLDFIGIQETMKTDFNRLDFSDLSASENFEWVFLPSKGRFGGILVGINSATFIKEKAEQGQYFVKIKVRNIRDGFCWDLVVVYGDAQPKGKPIFLVELVHIFKNSKRPMLVGGILI